jgi:hypothetical protein
MANNAWSSRVTAARQRSAHRTLRRIASASSSRSLGSATTWSNTIATLDSDGPFRRQHDGSAVDVRTKPYAALVDVDAIRKTEHLKAAAVGQDRPVPAHKVVQTTQRRHGLLAGTKHEMVGIGEDHLRPGFAESARIDAFHRTLRPHRHEGGCLDDAVRRRELAAPRRRRSILVQNLE